MIRATAPRQHVRTLDRLDQPRPLTDGYDVALRERVAVAEQRLVRPSRNLKNVVERHVQNPRRNATPSVKCGGS